MALIDEGAGACEVEFFNKPGGLVEVVMESARVEWVGRVEL